MPRDFTFDVFKQLLLALKEQRYTFQTFAEFLKSPAERVVILRHDVDARKLNSLQTARLEAEFGITGTYYFRMVPQSYDVEVILQIASMGHEIGYHYEDLAMAARAIKGQGTRDKRQGRQGHGKWGEGREGMRNESWEELLYDAAIKSFESNLGKLRQIVPIDTICMHGSPLSRYDNRKMWEKFNYRNYGIIGEPYFDVDFSQVMYLTDTGRRWDGDKVSIRDKVVTRDKGQGTRDKGQETSGMGSENGVEKGQELTAGDQGSKLKDQQEVSKSTIPLWRACPDSSGGQGEEDLIPQKQSFHSTFDIINAAKSGTLPAQLMINVHPQRWDNRMLPWIKELIGQRVKNGVKGVVLYFYKL